MYDLRINLLKFEMIKNIGYVTNFGKTIRKVNIKDAAEPENSLLSFYLA